MSEEDGVALAAVYVVIGLVWGGMSLFFWGDARNREERRRAAQCALATPIWPIPLGLLIVLGARNLIRSLVDDAGVLRRDR